MSKPLQENILIEGPQGPVLLGSRCEECGFKAFPARKICPGCYSDKQGSTVLSRRGKIHSFTRIFIKSAAIAEIPYIVGYVLLEDGITVPARLLSSGDNLKIGLPVVLAGKITGQESSGEEADAYSFRPETEVEA
jgi:uncharacterized OB-fold protein